MADTEPVPCIYCRQPSRPSKEHVLQNSLGGTLKLSFVCETCNVGFSQIDQALAELSPVALARIASPHVVPEAARLGGGTLFYHPEYGVWLELVVLGQMRPSLLPQLHLRGKEALFFCPGSECRDEFVAFIDHLVAAKRLDTLHVALGPEDRVTTPRFVKHRKRNGYVRAASLEAAREALATLADHWPAIREWILGHAPTPSWIAKPHLEIRQSWILDDSNRAAAKCCLNLVAFRRGPEFALRSAFDELREYIRGNNIVHPDPLPEGAVAVDSRFVEYLWGDRTPLVPGLRHGIALLFTPPTLYGFLTLYGVAQFVVRLGAFDAYPEVLYVHEFSEDKSGNRTFTPEDLLARMLSRGRPEGRGGRRTRA